MESAAISALRADREELLAIAAGLTPAEWKSESGCTGWSVQDVVAHLGALFWLVVDPTALPDTGGAPTEEAQDLLVQSRRAWTAAQALDDYEAVSAKALDAMVDLETQDFELPLGDLGTYHASKLANAFAFDHYTHIRADLFQPRGPLAGTPPASDEARLVPTLEWIEVAAPQQNTELLAELDGAIEITVIGTAARTITVGAGDVVARVQGGAHDLVLWSTQRANLADVDLEVGGSDGAVAAATRLHVF